MPVNIFVFSWNTQSVVYNNNAEFIASLCTKIIDSNAHLVAIGLQEDAMRDSHLLDDDNSQLVTGLISKYELLEIISLSGWGVTTYKALKDDWEYCPRGLRLAVFKRRDTDFEEVNVHSAVCPGIRDWFTAGKGGVAISVGSPKGSICFLNMHLPFSSRSIIKTAEEPDSRCPSLLWQAKCLNELYTTVQRQLQPDHIVVLGDLNFRVQIRHENGASEVSQRLFNEEGYIDELLRESDELRLLMGYANDNKEFLLPLLKEGVANTGPKFIPTCKLKKDRTTVGPAIFKCGKHDQRCPSWCDRILFNSTDDIMSCLEYDRLDIADMNKSDHAAVFAKLCLD